MKVLLRITGSLLLPDTSTSIMTIVVLNCYIILSHVLPSFCLVQILMSALVIPLSTLAMDCMLYVSMILVVSIVSVRKGMPSTWTTEHVQVFFALIQLSHIIMLSICFSKVHLSFYPLLIFPHSPISRAMSSDAKQSRKWCPALS